MRSSAGSCHPLRAMYLPPFAKYHGKTADFCEDFRKRVRRGVFGDGSAIYFLWVIGELPSFACERRGVTAVLCENLEVVWRGVKEQPPKSLSSSIAQHDQAGTVFSPGVAREEVASVDYFKEF